MRTTGVRKAPQQQPQRGPKVLRIGLLQGGKIIEEQIVRRKENVTIGQSEKNTFVIPHPKLPGRYTLFEVRGGSYTLNVKPFMEGRLSTPSGVVDLAGGAARRITLDEKSRGKLSIGDATLLFQFVVPPPVQPRPQLPAAVRGFWIKHIIALFMPAEGFIGWIWGLSLAAFIGLVVFFHVHDWPVKQAGFDVNNRFSELLVQPPEMPDDQDEGAAEESEEGEGEAGEEEEVEEKVEKRRPQKNASQGGKSQPLTDEQKAAAAAARKARLEAAVKKAGILAALGSVGGEADGQAGSDLLKGSNVATDIDDVISKVGSVKTGSLGDGGSGLGGVAGSDGGGTAAELGSGLEAGDAVGGDAVSVSAKKEKKVKGKASVGGGDEVGGSGILDQGKVTKVVRRNMPALRNCYERALKKNPTLGGKISVKFTIGTNGRVTGAKATTDTVGDSSVTSCVIGKFRGFKFAKPEGGSVSYVYPIVFKASN
jgi:outer membrane biosynthesis protein TonB